jgi:integrase
LEATAADAEQFRADLVAAGVAEVTARRRASAVHSFLRSRQPVEAPAEPVGYDTSSTALLSTDERSRLLGVLPEQTSKAQVLIGLLLLDGLKLNEVLDLDVDDVTGRLPRLDVRVARAAAAEVFTLHPTTSMFLHGHLSDRSGGPLLTGRADDTRLTRFGADYLVKRAGSDAGLDAPLSANTLRRAYVSHAHQNGEPVEGIRRRVGHLDARATRRLLPSPEGSPTINRR